MGSSGRGGVVNGTSTRLCQGRRPGASTRTICGPSVTDDAPGATDSPSMRTRASTGSASSVSAWRPPARLSAARRASSVGGNSVDDSSKPGRMACARRNAAAARSSSSAASKTRASTRTLDKYAPRSVTGIRPASISSSMRVAARCAASTSRSKKSDSTVSRAEASARVSGASAETQPPPSGFGRRRRASATASACGTSEVVASMRVTAGRSFG